MVNPVNFELSNQNRNSITHGNVYYFVFHVSSNLLSWFSEMIPRIKGVVTIIMGRLPQPFGLLMLRLPQLLLVENI